MKRMQTVKKNHDANDGYGNRLDENGISITFDFLIALKNLLMIDDGGSSLEYL